MSIFLGAVADDFTGASDLASTLAREGMRVVQVIGVPDADTDIEDAEAIVIALKSRTSPVADAIRDSMNAQDWLLEQGAEQIVFKYCSTFDSTPNGNIGPVADSLLEANGGEFAFVCPAFPENGRTIYQGHLFVHHQLLSESSMKDHPLTPMHNSNLVELMGQQSEGTCGLISHQTVVQGSAAIRRAVDDLKSAGHRYGVIDAISVDDLRAIGEAAKDHKLLTGGSGVAVGLPRNLRRDGKVGQAATAPLPSAKGRQLVLAGSCSTATRIQIDQAAKRWPSQKIDIDKIARGEDVVGQLSSWALDQPADQPVVIYGSADPEEVAQTQEKYGVENSGTMIERALGGVALALYDHGFDRIISAGGETSGAIVSALGAVALRIGPDIAPGVPWTESVGGQPLALALKSGNFGGPDFFEDAFKLLD